MKRELAEKKFWSRVRLSTPDDCWEWTGFVSAGYGVVQFDGRLQGAHRVAWVLEHMKPIPAGMQIGHSCHNKRCCNPNHLLCVDRSNLSGRTQKGEHHWNVKLTKQAVVHIRQQYAKGIQVAALAKEHGISKQLVGKVISGEVWKNAGGPTDHTDKRRGEKNWNSRLTPEDVRYIRGQHTLGVKQSVLAEYYKVSQACISQVINLKVWAHV
jgi:hypothetical protein